MKKSDWPARRFVQSPSKLLFCFVLFLKALLFPNIFYGLFPRWTPNWFGNHLSWQGQLDFIASQRLKMLLKEGLISVSSHFARLSAKRPTFLRTLQSVSPPRSLCAQLLLFPLSSRLHLSCHFSLSLFSLFLFFLRLKEESLHRLSPPLSSSISVAPLPPFWLASPSSFLVTSPPCLSLGLWLAQCVCRKCRTTQRGH